MDKLENLIVAAFRTFFWGGIVVVGSIFVSFPMMIVNGGTDIESLSGLTEHAVHIGTLCLYGQVLAVVLLVGIKAARKIHSSKARTSVSPESTEQTA